MHIVKYEGFIYLLLFFIKKPYNWAITEPKLIIMYCSYNKTLLS